MNDLQIFRLDQYPKTDPAALLRLALKSLRRPFPDNAEVGIKLHWGEKGNRSFLPPLYAREIVEWLKDHGYRPFIFDTTVLYSGGRREGTETLRTAAANGYAPDYLGCPVIVADGMNGRDVVDIDAGFRHFRTVQVTSLVHRTAGFVVFSHFKGHMASGFGGAIKNLSMGFASRAQKQRMHADVRPQLKRRHCVRCSLCVEVCPVGAARADQEGYPAFDLERCIGCAQCIGTCPELALQILWNSDELTFQEKLVETAGAVWKAIETRTVLINALVKITEECDCFPGPNPILADDYGFITGLHPVALDKASVAAVGAERFSTAHPGIPWTHQFAYAREIGFDQEGD